MKRGAAASGPSVSGLQRDLQLEQECRSRLEDSVEQLRLELQMMGRLLAAAREQVVASGAAPAQPGVALRVPPPPPSEGQRSGRSKSDARLLARLHEELVDSRAQCKRLSAQLEVQQHKLQLALAGKKELAGIVAEVSEYLSASGGPGI